jgi:predicted AlkP superfamily phosphohydrolase/phosphomutase
MKRRVLSLRAIAWVALALLCSGCEPPDERVGSRVILIGIDGASPLVTGPMMEEGRLPNLKALADDGVYGKLRSLLPLYSPRIWTTIGTGKLPDDHGIRAFVMSDDEGEKRLYQSHDRKVPALWNILSANGMSVGVVNWWTTYPPEKINGVMVSDHFFPEQIDMIKKTFADEREDTADLVHPSEWSERASELLRSRKYLTKVRDPFKGNRALPRWVNRELLSAQYETDNDVTRMSLAIQQEFRPDVMMVFLPGIDRVSHWLWGSREPEEFYPPKLRPTPAARKAGVLALERYYEFTDALIGLMLADYQPGDLVIVMSDHGFEAEVSMMLLTGGHETEAALDGIVYARGRGVPRGREAGEVSVLDIPPTVLAWLGLATAEDMEGDRADFLRSPDTGRIASYDDTPVERIAVDGEGREEQIVEHLRALGYLEEERGGGEAPEQEPEAPR